MTIPTRYPSRCDHFFTPLSRYRSFRDAYVLHARLSRHSAMADALTHVTLDEDDLPDILILEEQFGHDLVAFTEWLRAQLPASAQSALHDRLTSSDIVDTALAATLSAVAVALTRQAEFLRSVISLRALALASTPILARTHGRHAIPSSLGRRFAPFAFQVDRALSVLEHATTHTSVYHFAGPVGIDPQHLDAPIIGGTGRLTRDPAPTQVSARDRHAYFGFALTALAASTDAIATEIRLGAQSGIDLYAEPVPNPTEHRGSSAMPHKRNPHRAERITGLSRVVRHNAQALQDDVVLWNERDISHSCVERTALPTAVCLTSYLLQETADLFTRLDITPTEETQRVLDSGPSSPAVVSALKGRGVPHIQAYETVRDFGALNTASAHALPTGPSLYDPAREPALWETLRAWTPQADPGPE